MVKTKGVVTRRAPLKGINLSRSIVRSNPNFAEELQDVVSVTVLCCSFQEAYAMAPSSCAPTDAASLRGVSATGGMIAETGQMRGTVT